MVDPIDKIKQKKIDLRVPDSEPIFHASSNLLIGTVFDCSAAVFGV